MDRLSRSLVVPRKWTVEEDSLLDEAVFLFGKSNWKRISKHVRTRDNCECFDEFSFLCSNYLYSIGQCMQRWNKVRSPGLVKGHWNKEEDSKLIFLLRQGFRSWSEISRKMEGRTSKQCRVRWMNCLCPTIRRDEFSQQEDAIIMNSWNNLGNSWVKIAKLLPGRTENSVRSRFRHLKKVSENSSNSLEQCHHSTQFTEVSSDSTLDNSILYDIVSDDDTTSSISSLSSDESDPNPDCNSMDLARSTYATRAMMFPEKDKGIGNHFSELDDASDLTAPLCGFNELKESRSLHQVCALLVEVYNFEHFNS